MSPSRVAISILLPPRWYKQSNGRTLKFKQKAKNECLGSHLDPFCFLLRYFPKIYNLSGQPENVKKYGPWFDYHLNPRAQIFKRDQGKVNDLISFIKLMRYNNYKDDPLSKCSCSPPYSAENAISARSDLNPANGSYPFGFLGHRNHGGTDCKVTSYELFNKTLSCMAVSGPTHDQQPIFKWSTSGWKRPMGHPDAWNFEPIMVNFSAFRVLDKNDQDFRDSRAQLFEG